MNAARLWPIAIAGVLATTVIANVVVLIRAGGSDAAIEPDYYEKAVAWDSTLAERAHDAALGWTLDASLAPFTAGATALEVRLADRDGRPIEGARVELEAIHNIVPRRTHATLAASAPGRYGGPIALARAGLWELRFDVHAGREHFTRTVRLEAIAGDARVARAPGAGP
jgi:nitrogen fixation protein FixH